MLQTLNNISMSKTRYWLPHLIFNKNILLILHDWLPIRVTKSSEGLVGKGEIVEGEKESKLNKTFDLKILFWARVIMQWVEGFDRLQECKELEAADEFGVEDRPGGEEEMARLG